MQSRWAGGCVRQPLGGLHTTHRPPMQMGPPGTAAPCTANPPLKRWGAGGEREGAGPSRLGGREFRAAVTQTTR